MAQRSPIDVMRWATTAYSIASIWLFGWLTATFGFLCAVLATLILASPAFFSWRMSARNRPIGRCEYGYLAVLAIVVVIGTLFLVMTWFETGMDRLASFDREYRAFCSRIATMPEYKNVEVSYTHRKGGRVYLHGTVDTKDSHDRLIQMVDRTVRSNASGFYDGVSIRGMPSADDSRPTMAQQHETSSE